MSDIVLARFPRGRQSGAAAIVAGVVVAIVAACSSAPPATTPPTPGGTVPALATPAASVATSPGATNPGAATPAESIATGSSPATSGQPTGQPITGPSEFPQVLASGDFAALGIAGAHTPTVNTTGCAPNCAYLVYNKRSAADGGIELDIFNFATAADAAADYGDQTNDQLDAASLAALGADKAQLLLAELGNSPDISVDDLRVLKGKLWFDLGIPSNAEGKSQLLALAALVLARTAPLQ